MVFLSGNHVTHLLLFVLVLIQCNSIPFDTGKDNKYQDTTIQNTTCNAQTQVDFFFDSNTRLTCDGTACSVSNAEKSKLKFLDINGEDLELNLTKAEFTSFQFEVNQLEDALTKYFVFSYKTNDKKNTVNVLIPVINQKVEKEPRVISIPDLDQKVQFPFKSLNDLTDINKGLSLSGFNFLNKMDYSRFYHATVPKFDESILLSVATYRTAHEIQGSISDTEIKNIQLDYASTGDKLCYGSQQVEQIFQSHLRESWPLWTAWFAILFFWLYYLIAPSNTDQCFDKDFEDNNLTCWPFYSVHFIGHEDFFTRLSRITLLLINFTVQGVILAAIFLNLGPVNPPSMIIWAAFIAVAATHPVPYIIGGIFLSRIHKLILEKFKVIKKSKSTAVKSKQQEETYQQEIDTLEEKLFTLYYWYYVTAFVLFFGLWTVSIHLLKQLPRKYYTEHHYWIASLSCAFVIENLLIEPILAKLCGNLKCYQMRGFYYNFELGEQYKQIEE